MPDDNLFTGKIAGQPAWVWIGGAGVLVGGFIWWRKHNAASQASSSSAATYGTAPSANVPTAATSEELMAAGLYQPPNITYNVPSPNISNGITQATPAPQPSQQTLDQLAPVSGTYPGGQQHSWYVDPNGTLWQEFQDTGTGQWYQQPIATGWSAGQPVTDQIANGVAVIKGFDASGSPVWAQQTIGGNQWQLSNPSMAPQSSQVTPVAAASAQKMGTGAARAKLATPAGRSGLAPTRSYARRHPAYMFNALRPAQGNRVA